MRISAAAAALIVDLVRPGDDAATLEAIAADIVAMDRIGADDD